ncbi:hypothetical protein [Aeromicrobium sp. Leaf350]|uniref:hypothetical protein n=1 Tax=Aeromicrobium sp. Leaf350 TaxID=2876565 RepID=UPI001E426977|nr:hypothetical protein [Aeromicrobium sp. Leaf350]
MWDPGRGGLRALRAGLTGLTVSAVAVTSHVVGGGTHTSWLAVVPATVAVTLVAAVLGGRRLGPATLVGLLSGAQVGVHALSHYLHGQAVWHDLSMVGAHLVGVAVTALLLARGERLLWRLHAWLRPRRLGTVPTLPVTVRSLPVAIVVPRDLSPLLDGAVCRRGPPLPVV